MKKGDLALKKLKKLSVCAMLAALTCIATMISIPVTVNGYIHPGDSVVLLSAYLLGPIGGGAAAAIGSFLADIFLGYAYYAPGTFVIKLFDAMAAGFIFKSISKNGKTSRLLALCMAGVVGSVIMILGYFLYSWLLLGDGFAAALSSIPANILQAITGVAVSALAYEMMNSHKSLNSFFNDLK